VSAEFKTKPSVPFAEAKERLLANLVDKVVAEGTRYVPECEAFFVRCPNGSGVWCLKETRIAQLRTGEPGSLILEVLLPNLRSLESFMPWIENTLVVDVFDEHGMHWSY
jgi:hypothetical protein